MARAETAPMTNLAEVRGSEVDYLKTLANGDTAATQIQGFGDTAKDYDITVENRKTGAGVRALLAVGRCLESNFGRSKTTLCPEAYVTLQIPLGQESKWSARYQFYTVKK